ncbi:MAG: hypothetical protein H0T46_02070 [Deltaproteobacteria bacterium]|nr:hypothetical protein [Deltaproteobacteria bacterium]
MKKLTALITTLVLGASQAGVAMARPARLIDNGWRERQELRMDREREQINGQRHYRPAWVALSGATRIADGRDVIPVGAQKGRFTQLRFQTTEGASLIDHVLIRFSDGRWQSTEVGKQIDPRNPMVEVLLDGDRKKIDQIIVLGAGGRRASYQVFGI